MSGTLNCLTLGTPGNRGKGLVAPIIGCTLRNGVDSMCAEPAEHFGNSLSWEAWEAFGVDVIVESQDVEEGESENQKFEEALL